jgi:hypothetical protein
MKQKLNLGFIIAFSYALIYVVVKIFLKPNYDHFDGLDQLTPQFSQAVDSRRYELKQQQLQQYDQDKRINSIKNKVDALRKDLKIMKAKESDELNSIYTNINSDDSISQALSIRGGANTVVRKMMGGDSSIREGKNYNVNFNLDEE